MADIFREVDEDIRRERFAALARRFGPFVAAAIVAALLATAGILWWQSRQGDARNEDASAFLHAQSLLNGGKPAEAATAFADVAKESGGGYPVLAHFQEAEARIQAGDRAGAVAAYDALAKAVDDPILKDLAQWKAALLLVGTAPRAEIEKRLAPLLNENNPFRHSARETRAAAALQANDRETAIAMLQQLSDDTTAPRGLQKRARDVLTALGVAPKAASFDAPAQLPGQTE